MAMAARVSLDVSLSATRAQLPGRCHAMHIVNLRHTQQQAGITSHTTCSLFTLRITTHTAVRALSYTSGLVACNQLCVIRCSMIHHVAVPGDYKSKVNSGSHERSACMLLTIAKWCWVMEVWVGRSYSWFCCAFAFFAGSRPLCCCLRVTRDTCMILTEHGCRAEEPLCTAHDQLPLGR